MNDNFTGGTYFGGNLSDYSNALEQFKTEDDFWIGYGCHFKLHEQSVDVVGSTGSTNPNPEPATMFLFGSGLIGLAGLGRRKFFKKS